MTKYTLHHHIFSSGSRAIRIALGEYGIDAELVDQSFWQRPMSLLQLNPSGELPVMVSANGATICEAYPIVEFLEERHLLEHKRRLLLSSDSHKRGEARRLFAWFAVKFQLEVTNYLLEEKVLKRLPGSPNYRQTPEGLLIRAAVNNLHEHLGYIELLIERRDGLVERSLSFADVMAAGQLSLLDYLGHVNWSKYPAITEWYQRIKSRPSFRHLLEDKQKGMPPFSTYADLDF